MTVALLAIGLFTAGVGTMVFLRTTLVNNLDEQVAQQAAGSIANSIFTTTPVDGGIEFTQRDNAPQIGSIVVVFGPDGEQEAIYNGTATKVIPQIPSDFTLEQTYLQIDRRIELEDPETGQKFVGRVGVVQPQGTPGVYTQMVIQPLAPTDRIVGAYVGIYAFVALLILIATALLTRWLVTLAFRNLRQVETTAMDIAAGDFSQRLTDIVPDTEVGRLKTAINAMLARIDGALGQRDATVRQMRRFIGDASHELRTPLVTMRGYAELYRMGAIRSDEDVAQSMERIEKEAIRMGALVEDLLALARLDERRDVSITELDLRPIARDAALDLRVTSPQREVTVDDTTSRNEMVLPMITLDPLLDAGGQPASGSSRRKTAPTTSAMAIAGATLSRLRRRPKDPTDPATTSGETPSVTPTPPTSVVRPAARLARSSSATRTRCARSWRTCSATPAASPRTTPPSVFASEWMPRTTWAGSRSSITARASPSRSASRSSNASGAPTRRVPARRVGRGWACRSWHPSWICCTAPSRWSIPRVVVRRSGCRSPSPTAATRRSTRSSKRSRSSAFPRTTAPTPTPDARSRDVGQRQIHASRSRRAPIAGSPSSG